jgi:hypothetical protein
VEGKLYKISAYLNKEELRQFNLFKKARGVTQSGYIREMLGFEVRPRGAPKGPRKKKAPQPKIAKAKPAREVKEVKPRAAKPGLSQLSLLE